MILSEGEQWGRYNSSSIFRWTNFVTAILCVSMSLLDSAAVLLDQVGWCSPAALSPSTKAMNIPSPDPYAPWMVYLPAEQDHLCGKCWQISIHGASGRKPVTGSGLLVGLGLSRPMQWRSSISKQMFDLVCLQCLSESKLPQIKSSLSSLAHMLSIHWPCWGVKVPHFRTGYDRLNSDPKHCAMAFASEGPKGLLEVIESPLASLMLSDCREVFRCLSKQIWKHITGWWFQHPWKILVNWDYYSQYMEK